MSIFDFKRPLPVEGNEVVETVHRYIKPFDQPHYTVGPTNENDGVVIIVESSTTLTLNKTAARKFIALIEACLDNVESEEDETGT